ncbi:MAG: hypothetical protein ACXVCL_20520, partial [Bdellovibrio sp.]
MENKTIADFQGKWTATINYEPPIVSKSFVLNIDNNGTITGRETVTLEGNIYDQEINFSGKLTYHQTYVILDMLGNNDLFGQVKVKAIIDKKLPEDGDGKTHYEGTFENEFLKCG